MSDIDTTIPTELRRYLNSDNTTEVRPVNRKSAQVAGNDLAVMTDRYNKLWERYNALWVATFNLYRSHWTVGQAEVELQIWAHCNKADFTIPPQPDVHSEIEAMGAEANGEDRRMLR